MEDTGIKYVGFFNYFKKINNVKRKMTRMVCFEDSLEDAESVIRGRVMSGNVNKLEEYYISVYDIIGDESKKLSEHKII